MGLAIQGENVRLDLHVLSVYKPHVNEECTLKPLYIISSVEIVIYLKPAITIPWQCRFFYLGCRNRKFARGLVVRASNGSADTYVQCWLWRAHRLPRGLRNLWGHLCTLCLRHCSDTQSTLDSFLRHSWTFLPSTFKIIVPETRLVHFSSALPKPSSSLISCLKMP